MANSSMFAGPALCRAVLHPIRLAKYFHRVLARGGQRAQACHFHAEGAPTPLSKDSFPDQAIGHKGLVGCSSLRVDLREWFYIEPTARGMFFGCRGLQYDTVAWQ